MLSRASRMSTMSAQFVCGCSLLREHPTAPKPVAKGDQFGRCNSLEVSRERSANSWSDPFIGRHEHEEFLAELSELDLLKNDLSVNDSPSSGLATPPHCTADRNVVFNDWDWLEKFDPLDIPNPGRGTPVDISNSTSQNPAEDFLERTTALIDWKAWNHYLSNDWESDLGLQKGDNETDSTRSSISSQQPHEVLISCESELKETSAPDLDVAIVPVSGPLTWIPSIHGNDHVEDSNCDVMSWNSGPSTRDSSPERVIKRRGVKMKPPSDEGTNHRRCLNREAAFRYRERKRQEQRERKRELEQLVCHNRILKEQLRQLRSDIAEWRCKLNRARK
ncbi:hypothetical protein RB195_014484 [Necator americanus]|uniref:BZIP domain-containing protein n=1 Tax=Necator americanus TaxID=51031 RepID=A0ABR1E0S8_NECAM